MSLGAQELLVGEYEIGQENVNLIAVADGSWSGSVNQLPVGGGVTEIRVGMEPQEWRVVLEVLLHETFEHVMSRRGLSYSPSGNLGSHGDEYTFIMTHPEFTATCADAADFLRLATADVHTAWTRYHKWEGAR